MPGIGKRGGAFLLKLLLGKSRCLYSINAKDSLSVRKVSGIHFWIIHFHIAVRAWKLYVGCNVALLAYGVILCKHRICPCASLSVHVCALDTWHLPPWVGEIKGDNVCICTRVRLLLPGPSLVPLLPPTTTYSTARGPLASFPRSSGSFGVIIVMCFHLVFGQWPTWHLLWSQA